MFVSHVNIHQKMTSAEECFKKQVDEMACSRCTSQLHSLAVTVITQWVHEQRGHGGRDGGDAQVQQQGLVFSLTRLQRPLSARTAAAVTNTDAPTWHHSWE